MSGPSSTAAICCSPATLPKATVKERIEQKLDEFFGKPVPAFVRNAEEMAEVVRKNPFAEDKPNQVMAYFIDEKPRRQ